MNKRLARAVISSFRDPDQFTNRKRLQQFNRREWRHTLRWLDVSGLALYFLVRLKSLSIESAIPSAILAELEQRLADNKLTSAILFQEFVRLNRAFLNADLPYLNLKGFTLVPEYCPAPALRYQLDCDFLVEERSSSICRELLADLGYLLTSSSGSVMEFKAGSGSPGHLRNLYKPKAIRSVEIHLCGSRVADDLGFDSAAIARGKSLRLHDFSFPALCPEDMFIAQAAHLLRHVRSEWTRLSWLLEFRNFVLNRRLDDSYWVSLQESARQIPSSRTAIAVAMNLATRAFGEFAPDQLTGWLNEGMPHSVDLWLKRYGDTVLLSDYPGTKLYLLLNRELDCNQEKATAANKRLFPLHPPARITFAVNTPVKPRLIATAHYWRYFLFRLRFHIKETSRYLFESWRWKRLLNRHTHSLSSKGRCTIAVEG
jgi:hypothetical protein